MKLREYIEILKEIEERYGGDLEMVYAIDDEGNAYHPVHYKPNAGFCTDGYIKDYYATGTRDYNDLSEEANCVCVN